MDIQSEKKNLIDWLSDLNDDRVLRQFISLQESSQMSQDELTIAQKSAIDKGLDDINSGQTSSHNEVMKSVRIRFPDLFE